jgi:hypothetical protein
MVAKVSFAWLNWNQTRTGYDPTGLGIEEPESLLLCSIGIRREPAMRLGNRGAKVSLALLNWNKARTGFDPAGLGIE